jgi:hypothetical protein
MAVVMEFGLLGPLMERRGNDLVVVPGHDHALDLVGVLGISGTALEDTPASKVSTWVSHFDEGSYRCCEASGPGQS